MPCFARSGQSYLFGDPRQQLITKLQGQVIDLKFTRCLCKLLSKKVTSSHLKSTTTLYGWVSFLFFSPLPLLFVCSRLVSWTLYRCLSMVAQGVILSIKKIQVSKLDSVNYSIEILFVSYDMSRNEKQNFDWISKSLIILIFWHL